MIVTSSGHQIKKTYKICLQGASLDVGNMGCCALAASFIKLAVEAKPNAKISLMYANRTNGTQDIEVSGKTITLDIVNCRLSPKSKIHEHILVILLLALFHRIIPIKSLRKRIIRSNRWLRTLDQADFVGEIRGGDSFSDIYGVRGFFMGTLPCIIAILMQKDLILLPQTYGPFKSKFSRLIARFILKRSRQVFSRDYKSHDLVQELLGDQGKDISVCPDVAFVMEPIIPEKICIEPPIDQNSSKPLIGLNISSLLYIGGFTHDNMFNLKVDYKEFVKELLVQLLDRTDADVLLVPHIFWSSLEWDEIHVSSEVLQSVDRKYTDRIHLFTQAYDQNQTKGIIGLCDFFIGSRMHACIAAMSQCIPTVGLAYSKKFRGVFETVGTEKSVVDLRKTGQEEIIDVVITDFKQRKAIEQNLRDAMPFAKKNIHDTFQKMFFSETHKSRECRFN